MEGELEIAEGPEEAEGWQWQQWQFFALGYLRHSRRRRRWWAVGEFGGERNIRPGTPARRRGWTRLKASGSWSKRSERMTLPTGVPQACQAPGRLGDSVSWAEAVLGPGGPEASGHQGSYCRRRRRRRGRRRRRRVVGTWRGPRLTRRRGRSRRSASFGAQALAARVQFSAIQKLETATEKSTAASPSPLPRERERERGIERERGRERERERRIERAR